MLRKYIVYVLGVLASAAAFSAAVFGDETKDAYLDPPANTVVSDFEARFGYWGSHTHGSPVKVGEYQDLSPSPFYDIDALRSDGCRTLNLTITGMDEETSAATVNFYRPDVQVNVDYQRFIHNYGHDNLGQFTQASTAGNTDNRFLRQDVNPGEDYAFRVQELKANFKWMINDDLKVRLDVWGMYKEGERQVNAMQECYHHNTSPTDPSASVPAAAVPTGASYCHVVSQAQHIDWQTTEVKPVIEWNLGPIVLEYSRPMRVFQQEDQSVYRFYDFSAETHETDYAPYSMIPNNTTQIDQFKLSATLDEDNRFYGFLYTGNTRSEGEMVVANTSGGLSGLAGVVNNRRMEGADLRWTNTTIDNLTITPYARYVKELSDYGVPAADTTFPLDYERTQVGVRTLWRPFGRGFGLGGLAINGEFQHSELHRSNLDFPTDNINATLVEEDTISNIFSIGPSVRWSPQLDTYLKFKYYDTKDALYAVAYNASASQPYTAQATNSALPAYDAITEFGGTWLPADHFMLNGWVGIDMQSQSEGRLTVVGTGASLPTRTVPLTFRSDNYPCGLNGSIQANDKWTLNFGAAYYTNWIDQDQTFSPGSDHGFTGGVTPPFGALVNRIAYGGRAGVLNLGFTYYLTPRMRFSGQGEYVHGIDSAYQLSGDPNFGTTSVPVNGGGTTTPNAQTAAIPGLYRDDVMITRVSLGVDYLVSKRCTAYFRYVMMDYQDSANQAEIAADVVANGSANGLPLSGISNLFLGGFSATF
ncbi:MAG: hypothetical protein ABR915_05685 [Thermoguttaceae bacterium]|jgi:hypothetical protein